MGRENSYFDSREYQEELRSTDLSQVTSELEKYNGQFGLGASMARYMLRHAEGEDRPGKEIELEGRQAFLQRMESQHGITLAKTGISLEAVTGSAKIMTQTENLDTSRLRVNLSDRKQFLAYLSALNPDSITPAQVEGLRVVATTLRDQLRQTYELEKPDPRAAELLRNLKEIIENYQRLDPQGKNGLADAVQDLSVYLAAANGRYLKEHLIVERANLLAEVGGHKFGPSEWHTDMSDENYRKRWDEALQLLAKIKKNPNALDLATKLSEHLIASARYAKEELEKLSREARENKLKTLEETLKSLSKSRN